MPEDRDTSRLLKPIPKDVYTKARIELETMRRDHPAYRDDQLLMLMVCQRDMHRQAVEPEPKPYTDAQLLAALDYVMKNTGSEIYCMHGRVTVDFSTGSSITEAPALWLDRNTERLMWDDGRQMWEKKA